MHKNLLSEFIEQMSSLGAILNESDNLITSTELVEWEKEP